MIILKGTKQEMASAGQVSSQVELREVYLTNLQAWNRFDQLPDRDQPIKVKYSNPAGVHEITASNMLLIRSAIVVTGIIDDGDEEITPEREQELMVLRIEVEFSAEFDMPPGEIPKEIREIGLKAFAKLNGPYICMPYLRQEITNLAGHMKLSLPPLPTLKIQPEREEETKQLANSDSQLEEE